MTSKVAPPPPSASRSFADSLRHAWFEVTFLKPALNEKSWQVKASTIRIENAHELDVILSSPIVVYEDDGQGRNRRFNHGVELPPTSFEVLHIKLPLNRSAEGTYLVERLENGVIEYVSVRLLVDPRRPVRRSSKVKF